MGPVPVHGHVQARLEAGARAPAEGTDGAVPDRVPPVVAWPVGDVADEGIGFAEDRKSVV